MQTKFYATLRDLLGTTGVDLPLEQTAPAHEVLAALAARYPALAPKLEPGANGQGSVTILLNGRALQFLKGLDTPINPEDTLALFPPIGGG
ncbi:MAG TPA: ubiquitin-like small modifier protein 1 [Anaerolineae bacterium]